MKRYQVVLTQTAEKELSKLPVRIIEKTVIVLKSLEENPRPAGCKKIKRIQKFMAGAKRRLQDRLRN